MNAVKTAISEEADSITSANLIYVNKVTKQDNKPVILPASMNNAMMDLYEKGVDYASLINFAQTTEEIIMPGAPKDTIEAASDAIINVGRATNSQRLISYIEIFNPDLAHYANGKLPSFEKNSAAHSTSRPAFIIKP
ncbi:MAG: hypothetical protein JWM96_379 [Alphaproteobacteria bacterium]|nr:hypothetical protein [Alphaproteobacteria bacterium]